MIIEDSLLFGIRNLPDAPFTVHQTENACRSYVNIISWCLEPIWDATTFPSWCKDRQEWKAIQACQKVLQGTPVDNIKDVIYLPEYGCAILACKWPHLLSECDLIVTVVALDEFALDSHFCAKARCIKHYATPSKAKPVCIGRMDEQSFGKFRLLLNNRSYPHLNNKCAGAIIAILHQGRNCTCSAVNGYCSCPTKPVKEGFAKIGGTSNTSFPLVQSVLNWVLEAKALGTLPEDTSRSNAMFS